MFLPIDKIEFKKVGDRKCLNCTKLAEAYNKKAINYFKTKGCKRWIEIQNENKFDSPHWEYIDPNFHYFITKEGSKEIVWIWDCILASDFVRWLSVPYAFSNCLRIVKFFVNGVKYDSQLEANILAGKETKSFVDSIDMDDFFSRLNK